MGSVRVCLCECVCLCVCVEQFTVVTTTADAGISIRCAADAIAQASKQERALRGWQNDTRNATHTKQRSRT